LLEKDDENFHLKNHGQKPLAQINKSKDKKQYDQNLEEKQDL
jgi:hypothetical protein